MIEVLRTFAPIAFCCCETERVQSKFCFLHLCSRVTWQRLFQSFFFLLIFQLTHFSFFLLVSHITAALFIGFLNRGSAWVEQHITAKWSTSSALTIFFIPSLFFSHISQRLSFSVLCVQVQHQMIPLILQFPLKEEIHSTVILIFFMHSKKQLYFLYVLQCFSAHGSKKESLCLNLPLCHLSSIQTSLNLEKSP